MRRPVIVQAVADTHALSGLADVDGVAISSGAEILVADSGVYRAASGAWQRVAWPEHVVVESGDDYGGTWWTMFTPGTWTRMARGALMPTWQLVGQYGIVRSDQPTTVCDLDNSAVFRYLDDSAQSRLIIKFPSPHDRADESALRVTGPCRVRLDRTNANHADIHKAYGTLLLEYIREDFDITTLTWNNHLTELTTPTWDVDFQQAIARRVGLAGPFTGSPSPYCVALGTDNSELFFGLAADSLSSNAYQCFPLIADVSDPGKNFNYGVIIHWDFMNVELESGALDYTHSYLDFSSRGATPTVLLS
jgi:hypothetical protein